MIDQKEARESHELFRASSSLYARCSGNGEVVEMEGLCIANGRSPWFLMNAASLGKPVSSQAELAARANEARTYFAKEQHPWFFIGSKEWLGDSSSETLSRLGLTEAFSVTGMVAEQLAPPSVRCRRWKRVASTTRAAAWPSRISTPSPTTLRPIGCAVWPPARPCGKRLSTATTRLSKASPWRRASPHR